MRICFFGWRRSFDYYQIGGTESYIRRLSKGLLDLGSKVAYVMYDEETLSDSSKFAEGIELKYYSCYRDAVKEVRSGAYDLVITVYLHPKYRLNYYLFRKGQSRGMKFGVFLFSLFRTRLKLNVSLFELVSYDVVFAISDKIRMQLEKYGIKAFKLNPPVPDFFFGLVEKDKTSTDKTRIGYIGRADYGKGFDIALKVMGSLDTARFDCSVLTYAWPEKDFDIAKLAGNCKSVSFIINEYNSYSPEIEESISKYLKTIDVIFLPYRTLDTTIAVPLSIIEGLAAGCRVIIPREIADQLDAELPRSLFLIYSSKDELEHLTDSFCHRTKPLDRLDSPVISAMNYEMNVARHFLKGFNLEVEDERG